MQPSERCPAMMTCITILLTEIRVLYYEVAIGDLESGIDGLERFTLVPCHL